jgi:hypothetical protein
VLPETTIVCRPTTARHPPRHPEVITLSDRRRGTRVLRNPGPGGLQGATASPSRPVCPPSTSRPADTTASAGRSRTQDGSNGGAGGRTSQSTGNSGIKWQEASTTPIGLDTVYSVSPRPRIYKGVRHTTFVALGSTINRPPGNHEKQRERHSTSTNSGDATLYWT